MDIVKSCLVIGQFKNNGGIKMKCELEYCLYNKNLKCTVEEVKINSLGMCDEATIISLDKEFIEAEKETQLLAIKIRETGER